MGFYVKRLRKRHVLLAIFVGYVIVCQSCMTMRLTPREQREFFQQRHVAFRDSSLYVSGHRVHFVMTGNAQQPTLFFVHGSPGSWEAFKDYLADERLLGHYRMVAADRPGFGYSDFGEIQDVPHNAELLVEVAKKVKNGRPVVLVGHSLGAPIATQMMADHPELFDKLVLLAGSIDPEQEAPQRWRRFVAFPPIRYLVPKALRYSNDELIGLRHDLAMLRPGLGSIAASVLVIHGTDDSLVPFANVAFARREFRNASPLTVVPIANADHFIPWRHFPEIRDRLLALYPDP